MSPKVGDQGAMKAHESQLEAQTCLSHCRGLPTACTDSIGPIPLVTLSLILRPPSAAHSSPAGRCTIRTILNIPEDCRGLLQLFLTADQSCLRPGKASLASGSPAPSAGAEAIPCPLWALPSPQQGLGLRRQESLPRMSCCPLLPWRQGAEQGTAII